MALRDVVSKDDLVRYFSDCLFEFIDYLDFCHPEAIEDFLYEYGQDYYEWIINELGEVPRDGECY